MLIIHAPNVHQGGGRVLLLSLLGAVKDGACRLIIDTRFDLPDNLSHRVAMRTPSSISGRLAAEWKLRCMARPEDVVICFGNLPPLFRVSATVVVFVQNFYLVSRQSLKGFGWQTRFRIALERMWLRSCLANAEKMIVQTPSMASAVKSTLGLDALVMPFAPAFPSTRETGGNRKTDFIYVASGEPHKNHRNLIEAWKLLADEGLKPSLSLTLETRNEDALQSWITKMVMENGLNIENLGRLSQEHLYETLRNAEALIYPSFFESLGLPLLEASAAGLPVIAAELDYVRDAVAPVETFDPHSPLSIARAVKRHLKREGEPIEPLSPTSFLNEVDALGISVK